MIVSQINSYDLQVGGRQIDSTKLIALYVRMTSAAYSTLRVPNGTAGYVVPTNFKLVIFAVRITSTASNSGGGFNVGYGNTDVGYNSGSAPTTPIWGFGDADCQLDMYHNNANTSGSIPTNDTNLNFEVPAGKYPCSKGQVNGSIMAYGYLVAV